MYVINDQNAKKTANKSFAANILHSNDLLLGNINPVQTPSKIALPLFDLKNIALGNKLGNGSQSVVYEVELNSTKPFDSHCEKENAKECT